MKKHQNEEKSSQLENAHAAKETQHSQNKVKKKKLREDTASPGEGTTGTMWLLGPRGRVLWKMRAEAQQNGAEEEVGGEDDTEHTGCFVEGLEKEAERNGKVG